MVRLNDEGVKVQANFQNCDCHSHAPLPTEPTGTSPYTVAHVCPSPHQDILGPVIAFDKMIERTLLHLKFQSPMCPLMLSLNDVYNKESSQVRRRTFQSSHCSSFVNDSEILRDHECLVMACGIRSIGFRFRPRAKQGQRFGVGSDRDS